MKCFDILKKPGRVSVNHKKQNLLTKFQPPTSPCHTSVSLTRHPMNRSSSLFPTLQQSSFQPRLHHSHLHKVISALQLQLPPLQHFNHFNKYPTHTAYSQDKQLPKQILENFLTHLLPHQLASPCNLNWQM